jgi:hypothetical protein
MANPSPTYSDVRLPGADGIRIPTERAGFVGTTAKPAPTLDTFGELPLGTVGASTITLNAQQAGASLISINPTGAVTIVLPTCQPGRSFLVWNQATATNSVTLQIAGNATNTAVVPYLASTGTLAVVAHTGTNGGLMLRNG